MKGSPADIAFHGDLTEHWLIYIGERPGDDHAMHTADLLANVSQLGLQRKYLTTTDEPTIDGYLRFCGERQVAK